MLSFARACLVLVALCGAGLAGAGDTAVLSVSVNGGEADRVAWFSDKLSSRLGDEIRLVPPDAAEVRVTLDRQHFRSARKTDAIVVGVGIPRQVVQAARSDGCRCTALFPGADPGRQLRLLSLLQPGGQRVGVVLTPDSAWARRDLEVQAPASLALQFVEVEGPDGLAPALDRLLPRVDALLALGGTGLYGPRTARLVLLTSYRQRRPVVGPDREFVRAGSLATTYSSDADRARSLAQWLRRLSRDGDLPEPDWPSHFSVTLNEDVARAYDLPARDPQGLAAKLRDGDEP